MNNLQSNSKRIVKNTMFLYIRMALLMLVSLFTSRITLQALGVEDYGIYNVVGGIVIFLSFLNNTLTISTQRFLNYEMGQKQSSNLSKVFSIALTGHYVIALFFLLLAETIGFWFVYYHLVIPQERFVAMLWVYHFSVLTFIINIISTPYNAAIIACEKMNVYAYIAILEAVMKLLIAYLLLVVSFDKLKLYAILLFLLAVVVRLVYYLYCKRKIPWISSTLSWNREMMAKIFSFSGWVFLGGFSQVLCVQGVNVLINLFFNPIHNAARGISMQLQAAVHTFSANFMTAVRPQIVKSYSSQDYAYAYKLTCSSARISFFLLLIITMPILLNTEFILSLWLGNIPPYSVCFTRLALIDVLFTSLISPVAALSQATGKVRNYQLIISVSFFLVFVLTYFFYKLHFPSYATFLISIVMTLIGTIGRVLELRNSANFPILYFIKDVVLRIFIVSLGTILSLALLVNVFSFIKITLNVIIMSLFSIALSCVYIWLWGVNKAEKEFIINRIKLKH